MGCSEVNDNSFGIHADRCHLLVLGSTRCYTPYIMDSAHQVVWTHAAGKVIKVLKGKFGNIQKQND